MTTSLWIVKTSEYNEVYRKFVVRAADETRAIELVKAEMVNTVFDKRFSVSVAKLTADGFEEVILADGDWG